MSTERSDEEKDDENIEHAIEHHGLRFVPCPECGGPGARGPGCPGCDFAGFMCILSVMGRCDQPYCPVAQVN